MAGDVILMLLLDYLKVEEVVRWRGACDESFTFPSHVRNVICPREGCLLTDIKRVGYTVVVEDNACQFYVTVCDLSLGVVSVYKVYQNVYWKILSLYYGMRSRWVRQVRIGVLYHCRTRGTEAGPGSMTPPNI